MFTLCGSAHILHSVFTHYVQHSVHVVCWNGGAREWVNRISKNVQDNNPNDHKNDCSHYQQDEVDDGEDTTAERQLAAGFGLAVLSSSVVLLRLENHDAVITKYPQTTTNCTIIL